MPIVIGSDSESEDGDIITAGDESGGGGGESDGGDNGGRILRINYGQPHLITVNRQTVIQE